MQKLADRDSPGRDNRAVAVVAHRQTQHSLVARQGKFFGVGRSYQQRHDLYYFGLVLDVFDFLGDSQNLDVLENDPRERRLARASARDRDQDVDAGVWRDKA